MVEGGGDRPDLAIHRARPSSFEESIAPIQKVIACDDPSSL